MSRDHNRKIAEETLDLLNAGAYTTPAGTRHTLSMAQDTTRYTFTPDYPQDETTPTITLVQETTLDGLFRLNALYADTPAALNFASGTTPGGGFLRGANAQEESLCRASSLYPASESHREHYQANKTLGFPGLDSLLYTPDVTVFRDRYHTLLENPMTCGIVTCAAPNLQPTLLSPNPDMAQTAKHHLKTRIDMVLATMAHHGHKTLVMGAWGCGVFHNPPGQVAAQFCQALAYSDHGFRHVHFAIPEKTDSKIYKAFTQSLSPMTGYRQI